VCCIHVHHAGSHIPDGPQYYSMVITGDFVQKEANECGGVGNNNISLCVLCVMCVCYVCVDALVCLFILLMCVCVGVCVCVCADMHVDAFASRVRIFSQRAHAPLLNMCVALAHSADAHARVPHTMTNMFCAITEIEHARCLFRVCVVASHRWFDSRVCSCSDRARGNHTSIHVV